MLRSLFEPLSSTIDVEELFHNAAWVDVLRRMVSNACIFAWECQLDGWDDDGNELDRPPLKRAKEFYAAIRKIPLNFSRPSLLSIPTAGPKSQAPTVPGDRMARLARAASAADEEATVKDEEDGFS
jgi:hypothetical protein